MGEEKLANLMDEKVRIEFWKRNPMDKIWSAGEYIGNEPIPGKMLISFDRKKLYNIYGDYPDNMTKEERKIFEKEYPDWVRWFNGKKMSLKNEEE